MTRAVEADYLVVGAGASGMAFADALVDHHPRARVVLVDRRDGPGGHWRAAYPFVRLHQASTFYGVASTVLGGQVQDAGPEAGLHDRADQATITAYYDDVVERLVGTGRVELLAGCDYLGQRTVVNLASGELLSVPEGCRVVDARYLAPRVPAETPPGFAVEDGAHVVAVNDLPQLEHDARQYVVVGSGKTATDAIVWLLGRGTDPGAICWVRPRDPWMLNRALIQPDPAVFLTMAADLVEVAAGAETLPGLFGGLEEAGIMLRVDPAVTPTMAKAPTLGTWELELLRAVEHVVRLGHVTAVRRGRIDLDQGSVAIADEAVIVHCASDGLRSRPLVPIWSSEVITLQPVRAGFPCFGAALAGYVEATRGDDAEKNRLCAPSPLGDTLAGWARMNAVGMTNAAAFGSAGDVKRWSDDVALNPAAVPSGTARAAALEDAQDRLAQHSAAAIARLEELSAPGGRA